MDLHKAGIKILAEDNSAIELVEFIPVFHRWIQNRALDQLLIDVADYSHVPAGPGTVLVAHEGNYAVDETGNRRGLVYYSKHEMPGDLPERLRRIALQALTACKLLESDDEVNGRIKFPGNVLQIFANDRLLAPNTDATWTALEPAINELLGKLFDGGDVVIAREPDPKERFQVTVTAPAPVAITTLLQRISN